MPALTPFTNGVLLFAALLGLSLSGLYFLVAVPGARRARRERLAALQHAVEPRDLEAQGEAVAVRRLPQATWRLPGGVWLEKRLQQAGLEIAPEALQGLCAGTGLVALVFAALFGASPLIVVLLALAGAALPLLFVESKRSRRLARFEEQLPEAVDLLGRAVRAGHAFTTGFELIAAEMSEPVAGEFRIAFDQQRLGLSVRDALEQLAQRVPTPDVMVFVSALQIQRETGGNLAEILDKLSHVIRERFKLQRQVRIFTAEGRMSLVVLTAVPFVAGLGMFVVNREYVLPLLVEPGGRKLLAFAMVMLATGILVIRRMTHMKV